MSVLTVLLVAIFFAAWKAPRWVKEIGLFALLFGFLGHLLGVFQVLSVLRDIAAEKGADADRFRRPDSLARPLRRTESHAELPDLRRHHLPGLPGRPSRQEAAAVSEASGPSPGAILRDFASVAVLQHCGGHVFGRFRSRSRAPARERARFHALSFPQRCGNQRLLTTESLYFREMGSSMSST